MVLCVGLSLLNVSWFLVLYCRSCFLLRPGHLHMTPAAMLCQLIWRAGMLGARVASLMFFCSTLHWWSCGVVGEPSFVFLCRQILQVLLSNLSLPNSYLERDDLLITGCFVVVSLNPCSGFHWLITTFCQVSQQTDICINSTSWRLFNFILGAMHIFLFLNVKDGPSRYRMTGFYLVGLSALQCYFSIIYILL